MIGFRVDDISFYATRVDGHVGRWDTTIYIYGVTPEKAAVIADNYVKRWAPQGYGTTTKYVNKDKDPYSYLKLERRNSCE